jgi:hypothetical protein
LRQSLSVFRPIGAFADLHEIERVNFRFQRGLAWAASAQPYVRTVSVLTGSFAASRFSDP